MFQKTITDFERIEDLFAQAVNNAIESGRGTGEGERYSPKNSKKKVDRTAKTRYNSSIGWVYERGLFSDVESILFHQKISEINQGSKAFMKSADGEYMLPIVDKIVFTDGDYSYPQISKIIEVAADKDTDIEGIKEVILNVERGISRRDSAIKVIEILYKDRLILRHSITNDTVYAWETGESKGSNRRKIIGNYRKQQKRRRNAEESSGRTEINSNEADSNEPAFSMPKMDSKGNELTKEQQEYFKDSKVRDEDGNLLVVWHGTDSDFTVFDNTKGRANMDIQGMFFSPWELDAQSYGSNVKAYYINLKNPASESVGYKALSRFKGQNNVGVKAREYLESLGYDGVNNGDEEFIAFHPEQIKLVENEKPTSDLDIRFSMRKNCS